MSIDFVADVGDVVKLRVNDDGTTDLWFDGWRVTSFSHQGARPAVKREQAPPEAGPAGERVLAWHSPGEVFLTFENWNMTFALGSEKPPHLQPVHPSLPTDWDVVRVYREMDAKDFDLAIKPSPPEDPVA